MTQLLWSDALDSGTAERVRALLTRAADADGVAAVSEQAMLSLRHPGAARHVVAAHGDVVVGYANLVAARAGHPAMAEAAVDPDARGRGIGTELVGAVLTAGGADARIWAHGRLPAAEAVAARLELSAVRELWQMRRDMSHTELPSVRMPADIVVRAYRGPADDAELLRVNNAAFDWHPEQGGWTERELELRRAESWFDPDGLFLAFDSAEPDRLLGFHWTKTHEAENPPVGEVYVVGVDPSAQGRGLGRLLTLIGLRHLRARGLAEVLLYTEADNTAAVRTYQGLGFAPAHIDTAYAARL